MNRYFVPLNEESEGSVTCDILTLKGNRKKRQRQWRKYLSVRAGVWDFHTANRIAKELGFDDLDTRSNETVRQLR